MNEIPIFITGSHRCGSTWLANMLCMAADTLHIIEPFNAYRIFYQLDGLAKRWFTYADGLPQDAARKAFQKVLDRRVGQVFLRKDPKRYFPFLRKGRLVIKDPIACFSSDWLTRNFELQTIVLFRHPAAFAASLKRLNWLLDFNELLFQEALVKDHLGPFRAELEANTQEPVSQASLLWLMIYTVLDKFSKAHPDWIVIRHEDLSMDPISGMRQIYSKTGLQWTSQIETRVREFSGASNPVDPKSGKVHTMKRDSKANILRWKKILTPGEIDLIKTRTALLWPQYYSNDEW